MFPSSGEGPVKCGAGRLGGGPPVPAFMVLLLVAASLGGTVSCGKETPTEVKLATPTPTSTPTPAPPPIPTPFPGGSDIVVLTHDFPPVIHRGQEVTFTATIVGKPGVGEWEKSTLTWSFVYGFVTSVRFLSFQGVRIGTTPPGAEGGGWDIVLWGGTFTTGSRLSFTAEIVVDPSARLGYTQFQASGSVQNDVKDHRYRYQDFNFLTQIVP